MKDAEQWNLIQDWIENSDKLLVKKMSRNDCSWADDSSKHQGGFYVPSEIRTSGFFPALACNQEKPHIFNASLNIYWPAIEELTSSRLNHYSNKGPEAHLTRVPLSEFTDLTPASILIGGHLKNPASVDVVGEETHYWFITVDSASSDAEQIETILELDADFKCSLFDPTQAFQIAEGVEETLIRELDEAIRNGTLENFVQSVCRLPKPGEFAIRAQEHFLSETGHTSLNPFELPNPGDALMRISRDIEFGLYKQAELRHRAADVLRILHTEGTDLVRSVVKGFPHLNATFLSASQHRKSRAGRSFEYHIARLLQDGKIRFEEQYITSGRRPDFVLPDGASLQKSGSAYNALVLSAKTSLRERWKQVVTEQFGCALFIPTVDDRVSEDAINDMKGRDIFLVVPEALKDSKQTCYKDKQNVLSFRDFFDSEIKQKREKLIYTL